MPPADPSSPPAPVGGRFTPRDMVPVTFGALAIAVGAQVAVPMVPVPMTLQTLGVLVAGLLAGPVRGAGAAALYLVLVLLGLPVLAEAASHGGLGFFAEPSAGYVVGFVPAAAAAGWVGQRGGPWWFAAGLAGHAVVLLLGVGVLAAHIGLGDALTYGCWPFLPGAVVKSLLAMSAPWTWAWWRARRAGE